LPIFIFTVIRSLFFLLLVPLAKSDYAGQQMSFFVELTNDLTNRNQLNATLLSTSKAAGRGGKFNMVECFRKVRT